MRTELTIDSHNRIVSVAADWDRFAIENEGAGFVGSRIAGRDVFDFIAGESTRSLYRSLLARARRGATVTRNYRCDSPELRRYMQMSIQSTNGLVHFKHNLINSYPRTLSGSELIAEQRHVMCSMCTRIEGSSGWFDANLGGGLGRPNMRRYELCPACTDLDAARSA